MKNITLSIINQFTKLEIVRFVKEKLLAQNVRSVSDDDDTCMYRGPKGRKCAVGHLISDDEYDEEMESSLIGSHRFGKFKISPDRRALLAQLQDIHDTHSPENWAEDFAEFEAAYKALEETEKRVNQSEKQS